MKDAHLERYKQVRGFLSQGVWKEDVSDVPRLKAILYHVVRFLHHTSTSFLNDQCLLRASALTYSSLLSLVPLLALMFAILKGLGVQRRLEPLILEKFALGSQQLASNILEYIDRTNVSSLGAMGVVTLLVTAVMVLKNMERSFNWIWKVQKGRTWLRTMSDYLSVMMIAPFCLLIALSLTTYFNSSGFIQRMETLWLVGDFYRFLIKMTPFAVLWIAFTFCYVFMPNTRVKFTSALLGGIVGGTLWQLTQWGYIRYQIGMAKYNAIYGALSQLPILLVWIYISWVIVLFGAEMAYAHQNLASYSEEKASSMSGRNSLVYRLLQVLRAIGVRFLGGEPPHTAEDLSNALKMPMSTLEPCLDRLEGLGWIATRQGNESLIVFQRPPNQMPLHLVLGIWPSDGEHGAKEESLAEILHRANDGLRSALQDLTVQDLMEQSDLPDALRPEGPIQDA
jgi:membrane protein